LQYPIQLQFHKYKTVVD